MTDLSETTAGIGHNFPPEPTLIENLTETYSREVGGVDDLAARANAAPAEIASDDDLIAVGEIGADAARKMKELDALREVEKRPFLEAGRIVDGYFKASIDRLDRIKRAMTDRATKYQRAKAEAARREREEAERKLREEAEAHRREAERAASAGRVDDAMADIELAQRADQEATRAAEAAPVTAADATRVRAGETMITSRSELTFEITDYEAIPLDKLKPYLARAEIEKALRQFLKVHREAAALPGVRFYQQVTAQFRR